MYFLITVKENSIRCPNKNYILLKNTLNYLQKSGQIENVVIISDSEIFKNITKDYNIKDYYLEIREQNQDELTSCYNYLQSINFNETHFFHLNVTQPLRDKNLINECLKYNDYDVVTSYVNLPNRDIFKIQNNQWKISNIERKGSLCPTEQVADGGIYYINYNFLKKAVSSDNPNLVFWNGNIKFVENNVPFVDIDSTNDLILYLKYFKI